MSDFKKAFRRGVASSEEADLRRSEAEAVIADLARQLSDESGGTLRVFLDETYAEKGTRLMAGLLSATAGLPETESTRKRSHGIFVEARRGNATGGRQSICLLTFAPGTYPIEVRWETEVRMCSDAEDLGLALESLIEDPRTGKKFRRLMTERPSVMITDGSETEQPAAPTTDADDEKAE